ncbi:GNAT family N-acetyltransferase [Candidatus Woesearchaeota archaeon]|nr:GNAT family N-acetyltransferase [Candidatus Woesearchaeota archaeon]
MIEIRQPQTPQEWEDYFDLRYRILREPWGHPKGSERDDQEHNASHVAIYEKNNLVGVGRLDIISTTKGQIKYIAVEEHARGKRIGTIIMQELEKIAINKKIKLIFLNARNNAILFYEKCGYKVVGEAQPSRYPTVPHLKMEKQL